MILTPPVSAKVLVPDCLFVVEQFFEGTQVFCSIQRECSNALKEISGRTRSMARFGVPYTYKGRILPSVPFVLAPNLDFLRTTIENALGTKFNAAVVNRYNDGSQHLPMHSDQQAIPQLGRDPVIAGISWGATRSFEFVGLKQADIPLRIMQAPGDLIVMHGASQRMYRHGVPAAPGCVLPRWSVTFRFHT